jgi:hypothetical protein
MLNYKLLNNKSVIKKDNDTYIDLLSKTYNENASYVPTPLIVNKYYVARPDLISLALYGDDKYADIICKLNGISNPFELNENDTIIVPNIEYMNECLYKSKEHSGIIEDAKNETIQKIDKYNKQKRKNEDRSPNEQTIGESNFVIDKSLGLVFY